MRIKWRGLELPNRLTCERETLTDTYGKFFAEPFERGFGVTIGNSLRRILLSSLEGSAVTRVKLHGSQHEFTTLPGVVEDVTDIILNLKQVRLKAIGDTGEFAGEKIDMNIKGKETFTAAMIGNALPNFQVMNPNLVICNLHPGASFQMELHIGKGRGYVPAEENRPEEAPVGLIAIDSIYTPIKNVKYTIENTRVEQRTDFEKLIMEVVTDGTIHPEEAVKEASRILIQHLMIITDENISLDSKREEKETIVDEETLLVRKVLNTPLEDLELSVRAFNCLKAAKINSLSELVQYEQEDLMKFRNFGQKSLAEIEQVLTERGLHFGMDLQKLGIDVNEI